MTDHALVIRFKQIYDWSFDIFFIMLSLPLFIDLYWVPLTLRQKRENLPRLSALSI